MNFLTSLFLLTQYPDKNDGFAWDDSGCRTDCSWFGFKISVKPESPYTRTELAQELDKNLIGNRMLFGGNLLSNQLLFI